MRVNRTVIMRHAPSETEPLAGPSLFNHQRVTGERRSITDSTEGESLSFHLACVPPRTSHHAKRIVKVGKWMKLADKPELVAAKAMIDALLLPHQPVAPVAGPIVLDLAFTWPWRSSESKRVLALGRAPMTSRPDCDNVSKSITDRLMALRFIEDDAAVVDLHVTKWWGPNPGISVSITPFLIPQ